MKKITWAEAPPSLHEPNWGCVFCKTGSENSVAEQLRGLEEMDDAFTARQVQHRSINGVRSEMIKNMMPGYVFFRTCQALSPYHLCQKDGVLRLLSYGESWALQGDDLKFVKWLHEHDGLIGVSKVYRVGQKIVIASGPLKELEGVIEKVDRHNRNGRVGIEFNGKLVKVWLPFEYISEESL